MYRLSVMWIVGLVFFVGCAGDKNACELAAPQALRTCFTEYSAALTQCYGDTEETCVSDNAAQATALAALKTRVLETCEDGEWSGMTAEAYADRLTTACASESDSTSWRSYGGPQGAVYGEAADGEKTCMETAHAAAVTFVDASLQAFHECLSAKTCDLEALEAARKTAANAAESEIGDACPGLANLVAVDRGTFVARAGHQVECMVATAYEETSELGLECGPDYVQFDAPRGEWTQIVVDGQTWGTQCGDGSEYAFQIRLAPEGEPLDRIVIGLQGGGVCVLEQDCSAKLASNPGLFTAMDDAPFSIGVVDDDPENNPFANWTKVYLPYCNQDVFAGGGVDEVLGDLTLPRYGSVNIRAAIQMTRDLLWKKLDEEGGAGYRPDEMRAFFGGWSAGAYGTMYNYHWLVDDLQWPRTTAFPDAGMGLDNGEPIGVRALGLLKIPLWGAQPNLPPYCFAGDCAVGTDLFDAISPRLKQVPEQQFLVMTNPRDQTQQYDAYFSDEAKWINAVRSTYCEYKEKKGMHFYYTSVSDESVHVVTLRNDLWVTEVDGITMRDWMWGASSDPDNVVSRAEEADFVDAVPGVEAFPCDVAP